MAGEVDSLKAGDLVLAWTDGEGQIHALCGEAQFYYDDEEFVTHFEPAPTARAERMAQLERLLAQAQAGDTAEPAGLLVEQTEPSSRGQALITIQKRNEVVQAKRTAL